MRYLADAFEKSAVLRLPPATLRFFDDEAFPELANIHQGLLPSLGNDRVLLVRREISSAITGATNPFVPSLLNK